MPEPDEVRRAQETRQRFLFALYDRELLGEHLPGADLIARDIGVDGQDWLRIEGITDALRGDGYIGGAATAEVGLVSVRLTPKGRRFVEEATTGQPPSESPSASVGMVEITGKGNVVNIQQHSPGASQFVEVNYTAGDVRRIRRWLDDVEDRAKTLGLPAEDLEEIHEEVHALRDELERAPRDDSRVRRIGRRLVRLIGRGAGSLASMGLFEAGKAIFFG